MNTLDLTSRNGGWGVGVGKRMDSKGDLPLGSGNAQRQSRRESRSHRRRWFGTRSQRSCAQPSCTLQLLPVHVDTMHPQEIVEEEELERMKALLQRENLIRSLGIIEQLSDMLHPSHRGHRRLHEYRVRVPVQHLAEPGNKGCTSTQGWPRPRRLT